MFNYKLAKEIYGGSPWLVDHVSFPTLINILSDMRNGVTLEIDENEKLNSVAMFDISSATRTAFSSRELSRIDEDAEIVSVIMLNGPITKNGGMSSFGMKYLASEMSAMTKDERVKGHIIVTDSGGGASNAVVFMADAIAESQAAGKPVIQFIEKGGLAASAAYFIGSYADEIISESESNLVGSIGTMIEFAGYPKQHVRNSDGAVFVRAYATASINKNKEFEEAIKGNLEPVVNNILDPVNERFLAQVTENRNGKLTEEQLTGSVFEAGSVVGSLVDSIGAFSDAVNRVLELYESKEIKNFQVASQEPTNKSSLILKSKSMDLNKLKSEHPAVYQAAFAEGKTAGVSQEKDRVGAWMAHSKTDLDAVKAGIESGEQITATQREEFLVKGASLNHMKQVKKDAAPDAKAPEAKEEDKEQEEVDNFYGKVDEKLGLTKKA
jgi:protease-4